MSHYCSLVNNEICHTLLIYVNTNWRTIQCFCSIHLCVLKWNGIVKCKHLKITLRQSKDRGHHNCAVYKDHQDQQYLWFWTLNKLDLKYPSVPYLLAGSPGAADIYICPLTPYTFTKHENTTWGMQGILFTWKALTSNFWDINSFSISMLDPCSMSSAVPSSSSSMPLSFSRTRNSQSSNARTAVSIASLSCIGNKTLLSTISNSLLPIPKTIIDYYYNYYLKK